LVGDDVERGLLPVVCAQAGSFEFVHGSLQHPGMVTSAATEGEALSALRCSKIA
jgi:hypothetical protein